MASALPAKFVKGVVSLAGLPNTTLAEIAVSGRSNVGKSSLLNVLLGRKRIAKVSGTPGKTREINYFLIDDRWHLVDLPGYGYARVPMAVKEKWAALVEGYLRSRRQLAAVVQLVDARHGPSRQDREMLDWLVSEGKTALVVATKTDKLKSNARRAALAELAAEWNPAGLEVVGFSALTRDGKREILGWMNAVLRAWPGAEG